MIVWFADNKKHYLEMTNRRYLMGYAILALEKLALIVVVGYAFYK